MRVRIEKRGSWDRGAFEADLDQLGADAREAVAALLAHPPAHAEPQGGDRETFRLTVDSPGGRRQLDVAASDMPEALAILPQPGVR